MQANVNAGHDSDSSAAAAEAGRAAAAAPRAEAAGWFARWRHGLRSTPAGRIALKIGIGLLGAVIVAVGLLLVPLPGPGWLIVFAGIALWGVEFHWARRLLTVGRRQLRRWTTLMRTGPWPLRMGVGLLSAAVVGAVLWFTVRYVLGVDLGNGLPW